MKTESREVLFPDRAHLLVVQYKIVSHENICTTKITQAEQVTFRNICTYMHACDMIKLNQMQPREEMISLTGRLQSTIKGS